MAKKKNDFGPYLVPGSIIVAGLFMALAIYFSGSGTAVKTQPTAEGNPTEPTEEIVMASVNENDHIRGSIDAPVKLVEYSDLDCPFCQKVHPTLQKLVDDYDGQVAWIYRHAPLASLHPNAAKKAEATECVNEIAGNDAFWSYVDLLFGTGWEASLSQLSNLAVQVGVNGALFQECLDSDIYAQKVDDHLADAYTAGLMGTPYTVVVAPNGDTFPVSGSQAYNVFKAAIDVALESK